MPVVRVYQIAADFGSQNCLPRGIVRSVEGSKARTTTEFPLCCSKSVISSANGALPPRCSPARSPLI
ncbi:MAG: hypothetical protein M3367_12420 [Acidobacteriota bacterium]|nr:hypothetical protein [Acidobacteriota bacterium]